MALIWFTVECAEGRESEAFKIIKEKTGVVITKESDKNQRAAPGTIQFPDMETAAEVAIGGRVGGWTVFIDAQNHFFASTRDKQDYFAPNKSYWEWMSNMVFERDGEGFINTASYSGNTPALTDSFNIPFYVKNFTGRENIKLSPAYFCDLGGPDSYGFVKNVFINYERQFTTGLRLIDEQGRKFVTLGSYLLYQME